MAAADRTQMKDPELRKHAQEFEEMRSRRERCVDNRKVGDVLKRAPEDLLHIGPPSGNGAHFYCQALRVLDRAQPLQQAFFLFRLIPILVGKDTKREICQGEF